MNNIAVLGPNPAWQKTLFFDRFTCGKINRAKEMHQFPSGKGINFCRAAVCHSRATGRLVQFTGGTNGDRVQSGLLLEGIPAVSVRTGGATRCCTTCLCRETGTMTELIEPSFPATPDEVSMLISHFEEILKDSGAAAFCGTLPTGTDPELYARAARLVLKQKKPLLLDACQNLQPVFESGTKIWLKINQEELLSITHTERIEEGLSKVFRFPGVKLAAITNGSGKAYASDGKKLYVYTIPPLSNVVNPIGCGDTASAVWASELLSGTDPFDAFRLALAAASANCLSIFPGSFQPSDAEGIAGKIRMEPS